MISDLASQMIDLDEPTPEEDLPHVPDGPLFLQVQTAWLHRGLRHADDPRAVAVIVDRLECSHERWVSLIADAQRSAGTGLADPVTALYQHAGRVVGSLEHGFIRLLDADTATAGHCSRASSTS